MPVSQLLKDGSLTISFMSIIREHVTLEGNVRMQYNER